MSTVQSYTAELQSIQNLIMRQSSIVSPDDLHKLMSLQCEAFVQKLGTVAAIDVSGVDDLTQLVQSGPWKDTHKQRLVMAFSTALINAPDERKSKASKRDNQETTAFQNWAVQSEADIIRAPDIGFQVKINTAVQMMKRMGLILASEASKGHIMQVLLAACPEYLHSQTPVTVRDDYLKLKTAITRRFKNTRDAGPQGFIIDWPTTPAQLPESQQQIIFDGHLPVVLCTVEAIVGAKEIPAMRGNAAKLKQQQMQPVGGMAGGPMNHQMMMQMWMQQTMQHMHAQAAAGSQGSGSSTDDINLRFNAGPYRPRQLEQPMQGQLALPAPPSQLALPAPAHFAASGSVESLRAEAVGGITPASSPTKSEGQLSPSAQAARFMARLQGNVADDDDDEEKDDDAAADSDLKKRPASTVKGNVKAKAKAKPNVKPTAGKKSDLIFKPKIDCEDSRKQYLFRSGLPVSVAGISSQVFPYNAHGGKKGAETAAKKWLCDFKKSHKCA